MEMSHDHHHDGHTMDHAMNHADMQHDHGDHGDGCSSMHAMVFHAGVCQEILFKGWMTTTALELFGSAVAIFLAGVLYEGLKYYREALHARATSATGDSRVNITKTECGANGACGGTAVVKYLSTGDAFRTISFSYRMGVSTISNIVEEVCDSIWKHLQPIYLPEPTQQDWKNIASTFEETCQFNHCCGAIDGKHVVISAPPNSGSDYFNYKHTFSIVLLAVADAKRKFTLIDVGSKGRFSDGGIFTDSALGQKMRSGKMNFPDEEPLTENGVNVPYVFVGDQAFELMPNLMRPYPQDHLTDSRKIYNYRLCRARRVVENAFGILSARWRIYQRPLQCRIDLVDKIVKATCVLHNFCIEKTNTYFNTAREGNITVNSNDNQLLPLHNNTVSADFPNDCFFIREEFCNFFNTTGAVSWQSTRIRNRLNQDFYSPN